MSVQGGYWIFDNAPADREFSQKMYSFLGDFGPDGGDLYEEESFCMMYRPLHTTRESRRESQPGRSVSNFVITWDGRLDNREELIDQIGNDLTRDSTDLDVVSAAFEQWGTNSFTRFIGDWAVAIWNRFERTLFLARDFIGVRHLYYRRDSSQIVWCTNLKTILLLSRVTLKLDDEYVAGYLAGSPQPHLTPYREIRAVPPGSFMCICDGAVTICTYYKIPNRNTICYRTDAEYEEHFRDLLQQAVERRLRSEGPILAELSGGLDSTTIVCVADDVMREKSPGAAFLDTFSFFDPTEPTDDDFPYFTKIEERRGRPGIHVEAGQGTNWGYQEFVSIPGAACGEEMQTGQFPPVRRSGYRVILSGVGGDELLGGIPDPRPQLADLLLHFRIPELARHLMLWSLAKRCPWTELLWGSALLLAPTKVRLLLDNQAVVDDWICKDFAKRQRFAELKLGPRVEIGQSRLPTQREAIRTLFTLASRLAQSEPVDGVRCEMRYPYLDQQLLGFLLSIPHHQLLRPRDRRSLMRRALHGRVPAEVLSRRTKATTRRRYLASLEAHWNDWERALAKPLCSDFGYLNADIFRETVGKAKNGQAPKHTVRLLKSLSLELWVRSAVAHRVIEGRSSPLWQQRESFPAISEVSF